MESQTQNTELKEDYNMVIIPFTIYSQFIYMLKIVHILCQI